METQINQTIKILTRTINELQEMLGELQDSKDSPSDQLATITTKLPKFDFDTVYAMYPRKLGKNSGYKKFLQVIKTEKDYNDLRLAVINFCEFHRNRPSQFIPYFKTFMNNWTDWISPTSELSGIDWDKFWAGKLDE